MKIVGLIFSIIGILWVIGVVIAVAYEIIAGARWKN